MNIPTPKLYRQESLLRELIHNSIVNSVKCIAEKCIKLGNAPQEPDFMAALTLRFTSDLFNILRMLFPKNKFSATSVFCHQKPLAKIDNLDKSPEIGDILFVYIYTQKNGSKIFNSLLFQAKISTTQVTAVGINDQHQLTLYSEWPKFKYERAGCLNGKVRDILPKTINDGAQYLLIDNHPVYGLAGLPDTFPMGCATPASILNINNDLATELVDFLKFKSGRAFEDDSDSSQDDWSKMIWDILRVTEAKASKRKNAGISNFPRQVTYKFDGCCYVSPQPSSIYKDLYGKIDYGNFNGQENVSENYFDDQNIAPSVILIENGEFQAE